MGSETRHTLEVASHLTDGVTVAAVPSSPDPPDRSGVTPTPVRTERWPTILDLLGERRRRRLVLADGGEGLIIVDRYGTLTSDFEAGLRARTVELLGLIRDCAALSGRPG